MFRNRVNGKCQIDGCMIDYEKTSPFTVNVEKAFGVAMNVLMSHGFEITENTDTVLAFRGPGSFYFSNSQNFFTTVSQINIHARRAELSVEAEFGGIRRTKKYLIILVLALALFHFALFSFLFFTKQEVLILWVGLATFVPLAIFPPLTTKFLKHQTSQSLDSLLHNMIAP
jgi:hypothetical protein